MPLHLTVLFIPSILFSIKIWLISGSIYRFIPTMIHPLPIFYIWSECIFRTSCLYIPSILSSEVSWVSFCENVSNIDFILIYLWDFRCIRSPEFQQKDFPHSEHFHGFSPVWTLWCSLRDDFWVKAFPHSPHLKGFSPEWVFWCIWSDAFLG